MVIPAVMHRICPVLAAIVASVVIHVLLLFIFYGHRVKPEPASHSWPAAVSRLLVNVRPTVPATPQAAPRQRLSATRPQQPMLRSLAQRAAPSTKRQQATQETSMAPTAQANSAAPTEQSISGHTLLSELRASLNHPEARARLQRVAIYGSTATGGVGEQYAEDWLRKAKHLGILNFPALAAQQNADDGPVLRVRLSADGSLHGITIVRHARNRRLDEAAISLVKMSTPFVPFPSALAERYDALDIVRKWSFVPSSSLG